MSEKGIVLAILCEFCTFEMLESYRRKYNILGIIADKPITGTAENEIIYDYDAVNKLDEKIVIADDLWTDDLRIAFHEILVRHGLTLAKDYIYESMGGV